MADTGKRKAMSKFFKKGKKKSATKKVVEETPDTPGIDSWAAVPEAETTAIPAKKSVAVASMDEEDVVGKPSMAQVLDAEEASAALEQARRNAKKRELLGDDLASGKETPAQETLVQRIARRRKEAATQHLRDARSFPTLGGKKGGPAKAKASAWDLSKVTVASEELEAARAPKLEGEGDTGLGLKVTLQPGSNPLDTAEALDSALKSIAGEYSMSYSVEGLCEAMAAATPGPAVGGLRSRAYILMNFLHDSIAESWEPREMKAVGPGMMALLERGILDRAGVRDAMEATLTGWYEETLMDHPKLPSLLVSMIQPLVLARVILATSLPEAVVDACVPRVARLKKEEEAKARGETTGASASAAPAAGGGSTSSGPGRVSGLASLGNFLAQAVEEREAEAEAPVPAPAPTPASAPAPAAGASTDASAQPAAAHGAGGADGEGGELDAAYAEAGKKKKKKSKKKKGGEFLLEGEDAPADAGVPVPAEVAPPAAEAAAAAPVVTVDADAATALQDMYATAGKKKKKKAKKAKASAE